MTSKIKQLTIVLGLVLSPAVVGAQTTTAFKVGEETTGMTKQCYYDALGNRYTQTLKSISLCPLSIKVASSSRRQPERQESPTTPSRGTTTAFKTGERTTGMTKQCFYDGMGSGYTRTIRSVELCPLSIKVPR
jgi:hypothetical protein